MRHRVIAGMIASIMLSYSTALPSTQESPRFEAASVKIVENVARGFVGSSPFQHRSDPGRIEYRYVDLSSLFLNACGVPPNQIVWPASMADNPKRYDVIVTFSAGTSKHDLQLMWETLLTERFGLKTHPETKVSTVYAMTIPAGGEPLMPRPGPDAPAWDGTVGIQRSADVFEIKGTMPVKAIATPVNSLLSFPLVDMTGLKGDFLIDLSIPRDLVDNSVGFTRGGGREDNARRIGWNDAAFIKAVQKQLGLKIEKLTSSVPTVVIDHIETTPTPN
jgi:uncharacterized protein (TIGR03435 family)